MPKDGRHDETGTEAVLVRAGDLIGQLVDKQCTANLYSHVFTIEHARRRLGPHVAARAGERS